MSLPLAVAGADQTLAEAALGAGTFVALDGTDSTPGTGGTAIASYLWTCLDKPDGSAADFDDPTLATPTFGPIEDWGNYRLMLVVTDNATPVAGSSEASEYLAPDEAFMVVRVTATDTALQNPAAGERNASGILKSWGQRLKALGASIASLTIEALGSSTLKTKLTTLTDGSSAAGYHTHGAADLPKATTGALGGVKLAEAPVDAANPRAVTQDRMPWHVHIARSFTAAGWKDTVAPLDTTGGLSSAHAALVLHEDCKVARVSACTRDGGIAATATVLKLYECSTVQYLGNTITSGTLIDTITVQAGTNHHPTCQASVLGTPYAATAGNVLAWVVDSAPATDADRASDLTLVTELRKVV